MFIVFGWGRQTEKNHGTVSNYRCGRCNNYMPWNLCTRRTWVTLFFIPVVPYAKEHFIQCPICGNGEMLDNREFAELLGTIENTGYSRSPDNYDPELVGKTETQINYIKTIREFEARKNAEK